MPESEFENDEKSQSTQSKSKKFKKGSYKESSYNSSSSVISNDSESDVDHYYLVSEMAMKKRTQFSFSKGLSMQERVQIFRNQYSEFSQLDDQHVQSLIRIYDINL